jgi:hypothetical protein
MNTPNTPVMQTAIDFSIFIVFLNTNNMGKMFKPITSRRKRVIKEVHTVQFPMAWQLAFTGLPYIQDSLKEHLIQGSPSL